MCQFLYPHIQFCGSLVSSRLHLSLFFLLYSIEEVSEIVSGISMF